MLIYVNNTYMAASGDVARACCAWWGQRPGFMFSLPNLIRNPYYQTLLEILSASRYPWQDPCVFSCLECKCTYPLAHIFSRHAFSRPARFPSIEIG